jgi:mycothiol synthase
VEGRTYLNNPLVYRSLRAQKAAGMSETALVAVADSASDVSKLYKNCGFQVVKRDAIYRKQLQETAGG